MTASPTVRKHAEGVYENLPAEVQEYMDRLGYKYLDGTEVPKEAPAMKSWKPNSADDVHGPTGAPISATRYKNLCEKYGRSVTDEYIEKAWDYAASKGKKYKDYAAAAGNFMKRDNVKPKSRGREYVSEFGGGA
jgi:hypothetical protein